MLSLPVREKSSKLQFVTLIKTTDKDFFRTVEKQINVVTTKRLSLSPLPEFPVKYIPLLQVVGVHGRRNVFISCSQSMIIFLSQLYEDSVLRKLDW